MGGVEINIDDIMKSIDKVPNSELIVLHTHPINLKEKREDREPSAPPSFYDALWLFDQNKIYKGTQVKFSGIVFDQKGLWSYELDLANAFAKSFAEQLSKSNNPMAVAEQNRNIFRPVIEKQRGYRKKSSLASSESLTQNDLTELTATFSTIGVKLEFHDYRILEQDLQTGKLISKRVHH